MPITIKPGDYLQGTVWKIKPKDIVDTVNMSPFVNSVKNEVLHTKEITSGTTPGGTSITLPLSDTNKTITQGKLMSNSRSTSLWFGVMAAAYVYLTTIKGSYTVTFDTPPATTPVATWSLEGTTQYLKRGEKTVAEINDNCSIASNCFKYIADNKAGEQSIVGNKSYDIVNRQALKDGLLMNYGQTSIPMYPWIRKTTGEWPGGVIAQYLQSNYRPAEADIFVTWNNDTTNAWLPQYTSWNTYNLSDVIRQGPYRWYAGNNNEPVENRFIPLVPSWTYSFYCRVTKIDSYNFRVDYELPVRYMQAAAARAVGTINHDNEYGRDSYAWKDVMSKITITLNAGTFDDSIESISYSLDSSGSLTENVLNNHPLTFEQNELITLDAKWGTSRWVDAMPKYILQRYLNGKYAVELTTKARWAIENNIHVNSEIQVQLLGGKQIKRGDSIVTFQVKTIEKSFKGSEFVYNLKMLEV